MALNEQTGAVLWTHEWPTTYRNMLGSFATGPRATPTVAGNQVYVIGAGGMLRCLDTTTGAVVWQIDTVADYDTTVPVYGISNAPLVDGPRLIALVGGEPDALVVAFDTMTGDEIWRALPATSEMGYSQPVIVEAGGARQLIVWHAWALTSLNPETGDVYWEQEWAVGGGMAIATPVRSGPYLLVSQFFNGSMMMALNPDYPDARMLWRGAQPRRAARPDRRTARGHHHARSSLATTSTASAATVSCVVSTHGPGERLWQSAAMTPQERYATAFFVRQGDRYFVLNEAGTLIIARFTPEGYVEIDRTQLIEPTSRTHGGASRRWGDRAVHWSHPAYANRHVVVRNDREIIRASLAADDYQ